MYIINFIRGFCMALADSVPGVSGGTIAFVLGFYDKFINSLNDIACKDKEKRKEAAFFLMKIGIGWVIGLVLSVLLLASIFDEHIYSISSLFIGFIIMAIPIIIKEEKENFLGKYKNVIYAILGAILVWAITYFNPMNGSGSIDISINSLSISLGLYVFFAGMVAISAMVLPGISGSTLLLIFGLYIPIISAIKEVLTFNFTYLPILIIFGFGVLLGIAVTIKGVKFLLENYRSQTMYFILGLMIGSIYAVIMGPQSLEVPKLPMNFKTFNIIFFILGGGLILGLEKLKTYFENKSK